MPQMTQVTQMINPEAWHQAVMWRGVEMLPRLRQLSPSERLIVMKEADTHNLSEPLWLAAKEQRFSVPSWSEKPLTGAGVCALLVYGLWVQTGEDEGMASGLLRSWPEIRDAAELCRIFEASRAGETLCS